MITRRKFLASVPVAAAALSLTACNSSQSSPAESGGAQVDEISLFTSANAGTPLGKLQRAIYAQYEQQTGTKVRLIDAPRENAVEAFEASVAAGKQADVVVYNVVGQTKDWITKGAVVDAQPYLEQWGLADKLVDGALEGWHDADGGLLGIPYYGFIWPFLWNSKVLEKGGVDRPPATNEELLAAAAKFKSKGLTLISCAGGDWPGGALFTSMIQGWTDPEQMKRVWQEGGYQKSPELMKGIEEFVRFRDAGVFVKNAEGYKMDQQNTAFFTGQAAGLHGATWWYNDVPESMREDVIVSGVPYPATGGVYTKPMAIRASTSSGFWVTSKGAEKAEAVGALIKMFYQPDNAAKLVTDAAQIPEMKIDPMPKGTNPIYNQTVSGLDDKVQYQPLADLYMRTDIDDPFTAAAPFRPGVSAEAIAKALDSVYGG